MGKSGRRQEDGYCFGGFVGLNEGVITNCYSDIAVKGKVNIGGFAGENHGSISRCFSMGRVKGRKNLGGFAGFNDDTVDSCFFNVSGNKKRVTDKALGRTRDDMKAPRLFKEAGWDFDQLWKLNRRYRYPVLPAIKPQITGEYTEDGSSEKPFRISKAEQLLDYAKKINRSKGTYQNAHYILTKDIDLKKKKWSPIGTDSSSPFKGSFDGNGYKIKNLRTNKGNLYSGLFGYMKDGHIKNLTIHCIVRGKSFVGALVGMNDGGTIEYCNAVCELKGKSIAGGLVGKNRGTINCSFVVGSVGGMLILPTTILIAVFLSTLMPMLTLAALNYEGIIQLVPKKAPAVMVNDTGQDVVYPPVPVDEGAQKSNDNKEQVAGRSSATFTFRKMITFSKASAEGQIDFMNPGNSNQNIVLSIQVTDAEMVDTMGKTGRTKEEQSTLDASPDYDPESSRITLYESGAIPPGYNIGSVRLDKLPDGSTLAKGDYTAIVYLAFYNPDNNEKAMIQSQMPVMLRIEN